MRKKSRGRKEKKKGGCLKYFLYLFLAIVIFGAFSGSGDSGDSSKEETEPSVNAEASASASSLADSSGFSSSTNNKKVADEPQEEQAPNRKEESVQNQFIVYFIDIGQGDASLWGERYNTYTEIKYPRSYPAGLHTSISVRG